MSMVPLLFRDWWDEDDFSRPSRLLDQQFGLGLRRDDLLNSLSTIPRRSRLSNYIRPWNTSSALTRQDSGSTITQDKDKFQKVVRNRQETLDSKTYKDNFGRSHTETKKHSEENYSTPEKVVQNHSETLNSRIHKDYLGDNLQTDVKKNAEENYGTSQVFEKKVVQNRKTLDSRIHKDSFGDNLETDVKISEETHYTPKNVAQNNEEISGTRLHNDYFRDNLQSEVKNNIEDTYFGTPQNVAQKRHEETFNTRTFKDYLGNNLHTEVQNDDYYSPYQVILDVQQFAPNEITVKTSQGSIVVEGKHEEKQDEHGFISRHFVRRYLLPASHDIEGVVSSLSSDGILTVSAPKKTEKPTNAERVVPITQTGPAKATVQPTDPQPKIEHPTN